MAGSSPLWCATLAWARWCAFSVPRWPRSSAFGRLGPSHQVLWKLLGPQQALLPPARRCRAMCASSPGWPRSLRSLPIRTCARSSRMGAATASTRASILASPAGSALLARLLRLCGACRGPRGRLDAGPSPAFTAEEVVAKLRHLLAERTFQERAQYWGTQLRQAGGVSRAADLIVEFACAAVGACGQ
jgi:polyene glycosyltransferase